MDPVKPDYRGAWVGGLVPALLDGSAPAWLPEPVVGADQVVLLVLDGLGWRAIVDHRPPTLSAMVGGPIATVAPSTTAAALTSITTGLPPAAHGLVGYRIRVGGSLLNVLSWTASGDRGAPLPDPEAVQVAPPFRGRRVPVVTRVEFDRSGFTRAHLRGAALIGWHTPATLVEHVRRLVAAGEPLVYAYSDGVDRVAHAYGLRDEFFAAEVAAADRLVARLLDALPETAALLVTADHGQVHVDPADLVPLDPVLPLVSAVSGEGRFRSLHAASGAAERLHEAALDRFGERAWVFRRDELFDEGWLGDGAGPAVRGRVGDVVLAAKGTWSFVDPGDPQEAGMLARHGSLTRDEVEVPLLAARGAR